MLIFMDLMTCHHCGYEWKPRKKTGSPLKCARCQNPLWQSPRPKRSTISRRVDPVKFKPTEVPVAEEDAEITVFASYGSQGRDAVRDGGGYEIDGGSSSVVERPSAKIPEQPGKAEGGSSVQIPASPHYEDPLAARKARVQSLLAGVI